MVLPFFTFAQQKQETPYQKWIQLREENGFKKSEKYKGPSTDTYTYPSDINENSSNSGSPNGSNNPYQGTPYSEKDIHGGGNGGNGTIKEDPNIEPAKPITLPKIDPPNMPNVDLPSISGSFWKYFGIVLLLIALAIIAYYLIKNRSPRVKSVPFEPLIEDLNPAEISKTELELRLEEAIKKADFKECVRIYFLFSMKELIERKWIFWKKEKTNMHYLIEVQGKSISKDFEQIVTIYDLVWYGDYTLDQASFNLLEPQLKTAHQHIEQAK